MDKMLIQRVFDVEKDPSYDNNRYDPSFLDNEDFIRGPQYGVCHQGPCDPNPRNNTCRQYGIDCQSHSDAQTAGAVCCVRPTSFDDPYVQYTYAQSPSPNVQCF